MLSVHPIYSDRAGGISLPAPSMASSGLRLCLSAMLFVFLFNVSAAYGSQGSTPAQPPDVKEFLQLLGKADVQDWLRGQQNTGDGAGVSGTHGKTSLGQAVAQRLSTIRAHFFELADGVPTLGPEIRQATETLRDASGGRGLLSLSLMFLFSAGLGFTAQGFAKSHFWTDPLFKVGAEQSLGSKRRQLFGTAILRELIGWLAFCFACSASVLLFERDGPLQSVLVAWLAGLTVWVFIRAVATIIDKVGEADRAVADHACFWVVTATGWLAAGAALVETMRLTGMDVVATDLVSSVLGLGALAIGLLTVWMAPRNRGLTTNRALRVIAGRWLATMFLIVLWIAWIADAMRLFSLLAVVGVTPVALLAARRLTRHLWPTENEDHDNAIRPTSIIVADTVVRGALVGVGLLILAGAWDIDLLNLAGTDDPFSKVGRAVLTVVTIVFVFDALWQLTRTAIDLKITRVDESGELGSPMGARQARLRTLLPVLRNFAMVVFMTLAVLMTLSTVGIEIAPLIASAGVVGLAIGFGAQTLVKDVISGIFYLLDDAFRVGEYIVSGSYKGTVESFSLRSVRLRHHNGPVYTIPFSALGAVQNGSRDYAVDKLLITVSYDTDLEKARKLIKRVGEQLLEDPELAPTIIEPMKLQGVSDFGTYGIQLKLKTTTKPGGQSAIRKMALPLIKRAFDDNGIEFAHPTVKVSEGQSATPAAAGQQVIAAGAPPVVPPST